MSGLSYGEGVFLDFFEAVAECEAPEGTQVDDVLARFQTTYDNIKAKEPRESGMPAIIWSGENGAADRWLEDLDRLTVNEGYSVQVTLIPERGGEVILGNLVKVDRSDPPEGWPRITVRLANGRPRILLSDEIASIYIY